jgi:hypothetical protein
MQISMRLPCEPMIQSKGCVVSELLRPGTSSVNEAVVAKASTRLQLTFNAMDSMEAVVQVTPAPFALLVKKVRRIHRMIVNDSEVDPRKGSTSKVPNPKKRQEPLIHNLLCPNTSTGVTPTHTSCKTHEVQSAFRVT